MARTSQAEAVCYQETLDPSEPAESTGFTHEDEAFFLSDVRPIDECEEPFETAGKRMRMVLHGWLIRLGYSLHVTRI